MLDEYGNRRFFGTYRGVVVDNNDPLGKGRLKLQIPQVLFDATTDWCWTKNTLGIHTAPPTIGQGIWVEFEGGDPSFPIWGGIFGDDTSKLDKDSVNLALDDLTDVTVPSPTNGQVLTYNASQDEWVNADVPLVPVNGSLGYWGSFWSTSTQTTSGSSAINAVTLNQTDANSSGVSIVSSSHITFANSGTYNIQFSAQVYQSSNGSPSVDFWLRLNGADIPQTTGTVDLSNQMHYALPAWNYILKLSAGDYLQLMWAADSSSVELQYKAAQTSPHVAPATPSVILTAQQVMNTQVGPKGDTGAGVPAGGTANQILTKVNGTDYNTQWVSSISAGAVTGTAVTQADTGTVTSTMILDGTIVNGDISASAAIAASKISGTAITQADTGTVTSTMIANSTIVDADISASAAIAVTKLTASAVTIGTTSITLGNSSTTLSGITTINGTTIPTSATLVTTSDTGSVTSTMIADNTIVNGDISSSAAIAVTKLAASAVTINGVSTTLGNSSTIKASTTYGLGVTNTNLAFSSGTTWDGGTTGITIGLSATPTGITSINGVTLPSSGSYITSATTSLPNVTSIGTNGVTLTAAGDVSVSGNLTVNGTTTTINSTTVSVDDKNIELGSVASPTDSTADGGGITLKGATDKTITWDLANSNWTSSDNWNLITGKTFKINNTTVLSATTLGSAVVSSSLTKLGTGAGLVKSDASGNLSAASVGTDYITPSGSITGNAGTATYLAGGAAGQIPYQSAASTTLFSAAGTSGQVLVSGGTGSPTWTSSPVLSKPFLAYATSNSQSINGQTDITFLATVTQSIANGGITFNATTGVATINTAGYYRVYGQAVFSATTSGSKGLYIVKGSTVQSGTVITTAVLTPLTVQAIVQCAVSDTIKLQGYANVATALRPSGGGYDTQLQIEFISA